MPGTASTLRATVVIHPAFSIGTVDPHLFGSFVEHLGRGVYGGIYGPGHATADSDGFRTDVLELVRELGISTVRYPGGNFVSAYDWRDGIGPQQNRPRRLDPAWHSVETNAFGVDEFIGWCRAAGTEPMLALNLGTGDIRSALHLLEYVNHPGGTTISDERRANGSESPHDVRLWCLGNEMDGPWQIGHLSATEYGRLAARTGAAMRAIDPDLRLVVCGSSNNRMATFGQWEHEVLSQAIETVDYISCHQYFRNDGDLGRFLASGVEMDHFIDTVAATIVQVKAATRSTRDVKISFDEWNVWDWEAHDDLVGADALGWDEAPALLEDRYTVADAVVVGDMLVSLLNHADVVKAASLAQLVNVIGPIVAEPNGPAWRQTTFFPFADARRAAGRTALRTAVTADGYASGDDASTPVIASAAAWDAATGELDLYLVHRHPSETTEVEIDLRAYGDVTVESATLLHDADPMITNTTDQPERITPTALQVAVVDGRLTVSLPPVSWAAVRLVVAKITT